MPNFVLAGYLGCGNLGDDAVMLGFVDKFGPTLDYTILSGNPDETYRNYGFFAVPRKDMGAVDKAIAASDGLIFPGGSIFQDATSTRSVLYYSHLIKLAKKHKKRVVMVGQGVGPLTSFFGKRSAAGAFNAVDLIVVRDPASMTTLRELGVKTKIQVGADSAFLLPKPVIEEEGTFQVGGMKLIAIAPRPIKTKGVDEVTLFGEFCRLVFQAGYAPTLLEMDPAEDGPIIEAISKQQGGRIPQLRKLGSPIMVQQRLARMSGVIALRLHAGILATTVGVPPLMVSYDPKVAAFAKQLDLGSALPIEGLTPQRLFDSYLAYSQDHGRLREVLVKRHAELLKSAMVNVDLARQTLGVRS